MVAQYVSRIAYSLFLGGGVFVWFFASFSASFFRWGLCYICIPILIVVAHADIVNEGWDKYMLNNKYGDLKHGEFLNQPFNLTYFRTAKWCFKGNRPKS